MAEFMIHTQTIYSVDAQTLDEAVEKVQGLTGSSVVKEETLLGHTFNDTVAYIERVQVEGTGFTTSHILPELVG